MSDGTDYPVRWESDVVLADGGTVSVRPIRPDDGAALVDLHGRLSPETIHFRFFSARPRLSDADVEHFTHVDYRDRMALVATLDGRLVAVGRYDRTPGGDDAEVAFVVDDAHQGRGIGTVLLEHLAGIARETGITRFVADTLAENRRMLGVFRDAGFEEQTSMSHGVVRVEFAIAPTAASDAAIEQRDWLASVESIRRLLAPRSIAVIGASPRRGTIGHEVFRNLLAGDFAGPVYPVHPSATHVASVQAYANVAEVPDAVDLAVVVVPAPAVADVVEQCGRAGVKGLVVISAGFAETGPEGRAAERALVHRAHGHGMRMIGPNCMGVVNTAAGVSMNATFAPFPPVPGRVAFSSQSGALGIAILEQAGELGLGVSTFVSVGNKADVSGNDLLRYWEHDLDTDVVLLYLESFGNPRAFSRIARRVSRTKPIVAVKSGRTTAGSRGAASHTAALASPDVAVDALFRQTGVIRVDTLEQLFDVAQVLAHQPLPRGRRIAIVGNAGGPGILAADACEGAGLQVPELASATQEALRSFLSSAAAVRNPVDLVASAPAEHYKQALQLVLGDDQVDAVIAIFIPPLVTRADDVARAVVAATADTSKPVVAGFLAMNGAPAALREGSRTIPSFRYPESAAIALARAATYGEWRRRPEGVMPELTGVDPSGARKQVDAVLAARPEGRWLAADEAGLLLGRYGIPVVASGRVGSAEEAVAAATHLGLPVALKAAAPDLVHKSDVGGVRVGLASADDVAAAFAAMQSHLGDAMGGAVVQPMVEGGVETIVGVVQDPSFGPLVMFGTGGTTVELLGDRALRVLPLTDVDARELVRSTRGSALLFGYRGAPATDVPALEDLLVRVGRLADDLPEVAELDMNPVVVSPTGAVAVDVKLRLAPAPGPETAIRRLGR